MSADYTAGRGEPIEDIAVAGWAFPRFTTTRKEHWWAAGSDRSGCRQYGRALTPVRPNPPHEAEFVCAGCSRAAAKAAQ